jgi:hypothetical protein
MPPTNNEGDAQTSETQDDKEKGSGIPRTDTFALCLPFWAMIERDRQRQKKAIE